MDLSTVTRTVRVGGLDFPVVDPGALEAARCHAWAMEGVGHWLMLDRPEEFNRVLIEFLSAVEGRAARQPAGALGQEKLGDSSASHARACA